MSRQKPKRGIGQHMTAFTVGVIAFIYLLNPTLGIIEFIPDNFPLVGNLDEAGATLLLLNSLRFYGIDLMNFFGSGKSKADNVVEGQYTDKTPKR